MSNDDRGGNYDIDQASSGVGWRGTFATTVDTTAIDILSDGAPFGPADVTTDPDSPVPNTTITSTLTAADTHTVTVIDDKTRTVHRIPTDTAQRFGA